MLPTLVKLVEHAPGRTIFTRFVPPAEPGETRGAWRDFCRKWEGLMCVLATVVIVAADAMCSASDSCHDAVQQVFHQRFSQQIRTLEVAAIRALWQPADA